MSEGPIKAWRDSWKPPIVSTNNDERVCLIVPPTMSPYCGRRKRVRITFDPADVKCSECSAAWVADHENGSTT